MHLLLLLACKPDPASTDSALPTDSVPSDSGTYTGEQVDVEALGSTCQALQGPDGWLVRSGDGYAFTGEGPTDATPFRLQAADLGTYLLYDDEAGYLVSDDGTLTRQTSLSSDVTEIDDSYVSGGEWTLSPDAAGVTLHNRRNDLPLGADGLTSDPDQALRIHLAAVDGCLDHPELSLDATGTVTRTTFDDGDLYGIVDTHSHLLTNWSFGGGLFHGGGFHRLGVEHALGDCSGWHGPEGRKDFFGYVYDAAGNDASDLASLLGAVLHGELDDPNHETAGYPDFPDWPNARKRATHQQQYHRWLERAWMSGLRLVVQHATSNSVICNMVVGEGLQHSRYDCEDMTAVDRILDESWAMQRYIDAQHGGEGQGWFRIVESPAEAREVIAAGKLAVVLGIETSDLFRCNITPRPDGPTCDEAYVDEQLDAYYDRGVRVVFPVHKYDNAFTPGDGSGDFIELGNFLNSGHWTNMTEACPDDGQPSGFDGGKITFGGIHEPRKDYLSEAPNDLSEFPYAPIDTALAYVFQFLEGSIDGDWCQNATLTDLGEHLMDGMMQRGMIPEVDHFPMWSYRRAFEILEEHDYPAAGTHGRHWDGRIYALGGTSKIDLGTCQDAADPGSTLRPLLDEVSLIESVGGYPAVGFGFDLNGFAGARGPRFGDEGCSTDQPNPTTYPFDSYAGDVSFTQPMLGNRAVDFDTEGLVHIGLLPELLRDAQADAVDDEDLEPLFRSAEAYVRMWEKAEARAAELKR